MKADIRQRGDRRAPMPRDRYRATARHTGVRARLRRPLVLLDAAFLAIGLLFVLYSIPRVAGVMGTGADDLGTQIAQLFPSSQGTRAIDLPAGGGTVTAADPILLELADFTREPVLKLNGHVPGLDRKSVV